MKKRRDVSVFGLSFLDVMFCGFGSVILLVMIINSETLAQRKEVHEDLRGEVLRLETEARAGEEFLVEIRNTLEQVDLETTVARGRTEEVLTEIDNTQLELAALTKTTQAQREHINKLQSDLKRIENDRQKLSSEREQAERSGRNVRQFLGDGDRQYLTGLKVGGKRILILVDASASMLDESIVNIIRLRNLPDATRRKAEKWQRAVQTVEWLLSQLPPDSEFQAYRFNIDAIPLAGEPGVWLSANQSSNLDAAVAALNRVTPAGGTSLYNAFSVVKNFQRRPDNIILLTDGLPTLGKSGHSGGRVSGKKRMDYFNQAARILPGNIPLNTILFPIEGDPFAASEYWKLAIESSGSFMSPSRDWP